jgi:Flp pilus assembly protein TadG
MRRILQSLLRRLRSETGASAVAETLFVVMPLALIFSGAVDLVAYTNASMRLSSAAYLVEESVARSGAYTPAAQEAVAQALQGFSSWQVMAPSGTVPPATEFSVTVTGDYSLPLGFWQGVLPGQQEVTVTGETFATAP